MGWRSFVWSFKFCRRAPTDQDATEPVCFSLNLLTPRIWCLTGENVLSLCVILSRSSQKNLNAISQLVVSFSSPFCYEIFKADCCLFFSHISSPSLLKPSGNQTCAIRITLTIKTIAEPQFLWNECKPGLYCFWIQWDWFKTDHQLCLGKQTIRPVTIDFPGPPCLIDRQIKLSPGSTSRTIQTRTFYHNDTVLIASLFVIHAASKGLK